MKSILIFGPFIDEYSLSRVNRSLALSLDRYAREEAHDYEVKLSVSKDIVPKSPTKDQLEKYEGLAEIYEEFNPEKTWDLIIYNSFPRDQDSLHGLKDLNAKVKLAYLAWEEDRYPEKWVKEYNENLSAVLVTTTHVKQVLQRSGVEVPILLLHNGLSEQILKSGEDFQIKNEAFKDETQRESAPFRFLHISSGMERKAPRELITAYTQAFSKDDNVQLIIKSFPNVNNLFNELVPDVMSDPEAPQIEFIERGDLTEQEMIDLYKSCDAYVCPSKAEGFNLPALEAMYLGLPVITTAWSGHMDFVSEETSYLVDYHLAPAKSHLDNPGAFWAEVEVDDLVEKFSQAYSQRGTSDQELKISLARKVAKDYTWENTSKKLTQYLPGLLHVCEFQDKNLGVISTYNSVCGIAEYSSYLYDDLKGVFENVTFVANLDAKGRQKIDDKSIKRLWEYGELDFQKFFSWLDENQKNPDKKIEVFHIQYNLGFYTFDVLARLIEGLKDRGIKVLLTAHSVQTKDAELGIIKDALEKIDQLHVLNQKDVAYLEGLGLKNVHFFPHGNSVFPENQKTRLQEKFSLSRYSPIVATHGFMVEKKGLMETLEAVALLKEDYPDILYLAINAVNENNMNSQGLKEQFSKRVIELGLEKNVVHIDDFLDRSDVLLGLQAADLVIFAYDEATETASGSIRMAMGAARPIVGTTSSQLHDVQDMCYLIADNAPVKIAQAVKDLLSDPVKYFDHKQRVINYARNLNWSNLQLKYVQLLSQLF
jgi:glycosyltransferase involved in cell wall biosynthesis